MSDTPTINVPILDGAILLRLAGHIPLIAGLNSEGKPVPIKANDDGSISVVSGGAQRLMSFSNPTGDGNIPAGTVSVGFIFSSDFVGSIGGNPYTGAGDAAEGFTAPDGDTLPQINYTISAGSARIVRIY